MHTQSMLAVARRFLVTHNQPGYQQAFDDYFTPDLIVHEYLPGLPDSMPRDVYEQFIAGFRAALPDIRNELVDSFAADDRVALRWVGYGTHTGAPLIGIPAAGRVVVAHGIYILRFSGDRIAEVWNHWDNLNVLEQLRASTGSGTTTAGVVPDAIASSR